jgi:hypothetical protein
MTLWPVGILIVAGASGIAIAGTGGASHPTTLIPVQQAASDVTRTSGNSHVESDDPQSTTVNLRPCSRFPYVGETTACQGVADVLPNNATVTMRCWEDGGTVPGHSDTDRRWFYVTEVDDGLNPHPDRSDWIFSGEIPVSEQVITPACSNEIINQYPYNPADPDPWNPKLAITGTCTTAGGTLHSTSYDFTPDNPFQITVTRPDGMAYPLTPDESSGIVRSDGSIDWNWDCANDPSGIYTTVVTDVGSGGNDTGPVTFTIGAAPQTSTTTPQAPPTTSAPAPSTPPPPTSGTVVSTPRPKRPTAAPTTAPTPPPAPQQPTMWTEQSGTHGSPTFTDPFNASGMGQRIGDMQTVQVLCRVYAPAIASANPDGWWYRIATPPWNGTYYAVANTFWNGDTPGQTPYTHNTDFNVAVC